MPRTIIRATGASYLRSAGRPRRALACAWIAWLASACTPVGEINRGRPQQTPATATAPIGADADAGELESGLDAAAR